jgi:hypothetical protein
MNKIPPENTANKMSIDFLRCAEIDLVSSRCLYMFDNYSTSIYHLQQAVEKTLKSMLLFQGKSLAELKHHKTMLACSNFLGIDKALELIPDKNLAGRIRNIFEFEKRSSDLEACARCTYDEIFKNITNLFGLLKDVEVQLSTGLEIQLPNEEKVEIIAMLRWSLFISILAYYLAPHEAYTRYPDGIITPLDYSPDKLGIVRIAPQFCDFLHIIIVKQYKLYGESPTILDQID